jgi:hypothetical protein
VYIMPSRVALHSPVNITLSKSTFMLFSDYFSLFSRCIHFKGGLATIFLHSLMLLKIWNLVLLDRLDVFGKPTDPKISLLVSRRMRRISLFIYAYDHSRVDKWVSPRFTFVWPFTKGCWVQLNNFFNRSMITIFSLFEGSFVYHEDPELLLFFHSQSKWLFCPRCI